MGQHAAIQADLVGQGAAVGAHGAIGHRGQTDATGGHCCMKLYELP